MTKVKLVRRLKGWTGDAALYSVTPPLEDDVHYVIISAIDTFIGHIRAHETYIFPAKEDGKPISYCELPGSAKGTTSHEEVIDNAGWELVP